MLEVSLLTLQTNYYKSISVDRKSKFNFQTYTIHFFSTVCLNCCDWMLHLHDFMCVIHKSNVFVIIMHVHV